MNNKICTKQVNNTSWCDSPLLNCLEMTFNHYIYYGPLTSKIIMKHMGFLYSYVLVLLMYEPYQLFRLSFIKYSKNNF